jgi:tetratricopeptide (TPR) repeat protein
MFYVRRTIAVLRHFRPRTAFERAAAALNKGRADEALVLLDEMLLREERPSLRARIQSKRAVALIALRRRDEARAVLNLALGEDERCAPALVNFGNLLLEDGDPAHAVEYYNAAIQADSEYAGAYFNLGVALKKMGRRSEAVRHLRTAQRLEMRRDV